jgi:hypothetical protein
MRHCFPPLGFFFFRVIISHYRIENSDNSKTKKSKPLMCVMERRRSTDVARIRLSVHDSSTGGVNSFDTHRARVGK